VAAIAVLVASPLLAPLPLREFVPFGIFLELVPFGLFGVGCYYAAVAKGRSGAWAVLGFFLPPVGALWTELLTDRHADELEADQQRCPSCGKPYRRSDYRADAPVICCSGCKSELPRSDDELPEPCAAASAQVQAG
jgi:hypothetical protein